jgi:hypothetical protein
MAWPHLKAATESDLYDGQGSYKNIMYRICSLVRKEGQQHAGWCTASEKYIAQTTGFSERQVQRAVAQFRRDKVFAVRTYRKGGKEFNHYKPNENVFNSRKRNLEEPVLVSETLPGDAEAGEEEGTRQAGVSPRDTLSSATRQRGGVVGIATEEEMSEVNAFPAICKTELRSDSKGWVRQRALLPLIAHSKGRLIVLPCDETAKCLETEPLPIGNL